MNTIPNRPDFTLYQRGAVLLILCALAGCEAFLVSICQFEDRPACKADSSSSPDLAEKKPESDGGPAPVVMEERKFVRRASLPISFANCQKFNGIIDRKILTLARNSCTASPAWEAWDIDLDNPSMKYFNATGVGGYPKIPSTGFNFSLDEIYTSGGKFYYLQRSGSRQLFELVGDKQNQIMEIELPPSPQPRAFAHPSLNILAVLIDPIPGFSHPAFVFSGGFRYPFESSNLLKSLVVGDLDGNDPTSNGMEIIAFEGAVPATVIHWDPNTGSSVPDKDLLTSLKQSIDRVSPTGLNAIEAAFIADISDDKFPDFVYSRSGQIYVTSYLGHDKSTDSRFKDWTGKAAGISGEIVRSLVAVELTNDAYPELVVETDKAVHFYVNTPK